MNDVKLWLRLFDARKDERLSLTLFSQWTCPSLLSSLFLVLMFLLDDFIFDVFCIEFLKANRVDPDEMLLSSASGPDLQCLHMPP